ncbi:MAG: glycosyltransferase, group 1 family domain/glycosyl transferase, group 2 family domain protein [Acidobacteria bacterium]|nr:glycosyltransferase, group 1 family domain/glycosyl transferase, group 2 family domain protein [Acidobacteriota bacterium]
MTDQANEPLRKTVEAQADRIRSLERQLEARTAALDAATRECAQLSARLRTHAPPEARPAPQPHLSAPQRIRKAVILLGGRLLPKAAKRLIRKFWNPWAEPQRIVSPRRPMLALTLRPATSYDIICFSIIDWSFRWQRPQQLLSQFADAGHRVFVFKITGFLQPGAGRFGIAEVRENVWEITLAPPVVFDVYSGTIPSVTVDWFPSLFDDMRRELNIISAVSIVQVATWREVAEEARRRYGWRVVYDCMDEWNSFPGMKGELLAAEERLVAEADLVSVSGQRLLDKWRGRNAHVELVRNATDFGHFAAPQTQRLLEGIPHPIAGYFGAIAQWFDIALVAAMAAERPDISFVLIGGVFDVDVRPLQRLPNVHLLGQQPYSRMPAYLRDFDVCLIPFVVNEITAATDPVKFYEYISLGKPVVSTWMPELEPYGELLYLARDKDGYSRALDAALAERDEARFAARIAVARENTWAVRASLLRSAIAEVHPRVSIIIVSYNNIELTRLCLDSVLRNSMHPNLEVLVVDNASGDGSAEWLQGLTDERVRVLVNRENAGFAAANNQGLRMATGTHFVLLNNDTVVPRGWLQGMLRQLDDPHVGLAVAVTNFSGNESRIDVPYTTLDGMQPFAERLMREREGQRFDIRVAAMYCVGMRRDVYERLGPLDEEFGLGMFEDDDYSHRARLAGLRVICMEDVFVHHFGQASFSKLAPETYEALWKRNQAHFEQKWNVRWEPHRGR